MPLLAAVLGDPIEHSLSPILHNHWLRRYGIKGYYVPIHVEKQNFSSTLEALNRLGFSGANVTVPHKQQALQLADHASETAYRIGAANMLTFTANGIYADNTDAFGFTWNIIDKLPAWQPSRAAVMGAGGASRAVLTALIDRGVGEIRLANRSLARAKSLADDFGAVVQPVPWADRHDCLEGCDTLVNATSLGMTGKPALDLRIEALPYDALVTDLVYKPLDTSLLVAARNRGNPVVDGLGMLLHQGGPAFERWFGTKPMVDDELRKEMLKKT